jgi:hypothetical protein
MWSDVSRWAGWDPLVESAELDGPFAPGSRIRLKTLGAPRRSIRLVEVVPAARYRSEDRMPLARFEFDHTVTATEEGAEIVYRQAIEGALAGLFGRLFGKRMAATLPGRVRAAAARAEELEQTLDA